MLFNTFGNKKNKSLLVMHGMLNDWKVFYEKFKSLEEDYYLIVPAMDGCYDGAPDFTSFADQCRQIEEFVISNLNGRLDAVYGLSQGATLMDELLSRGNIEVSYAFLDGLYVAHQGKLVGKITANQMIKMKKNNGAITGIFKIAMCLMGIGEEEKAELECIYWGVSDNTIRRNAVENYTYRQKPSIKNTKTQIYLWCGSKEPYAIKSNKILMKYKPDCKVEIMPDMAHGQLFFFNSSSLCDRIKAVVTL